MVSPSYVTKDIGDGRTDADGSHGSILSKLDVARNDRRDAHVGMLKRSQGCLANARCALVTATPRGASRIGKSSHGVGDNQVWIVLIMRSLICSSACSTSWCPLG